MEPGDHHIRPNALRETGCDPYNAAHNCSLRRLDAADEWRIYLSGAQMMSKWPAGDECHAIGQLITANVTEVRWNPYSWAGAVADYHTSEPAPGAGRVHVAYGYNELNPDMGHEWRLNRVVHEFAHWNGAPQTGPDGDPAAATARRCLGV